MTDNGDCKHNQHGILEKVSAQNYVFAEYTCNSLFTAQRARHAFSNDSLFFNNCLNNSLFDIHFHESKSSTKALRNIDNFNLAKDSYRNNLHKLYDVV